MMKNDTFNLLLKNTPHSCPPKQAEIHNAIFLDVPNFTIGMANQSLDIILFYNNFGMNIWSTLVDLSMRKHFILKLFWIFLEAHLTPFSQQVLTRIIILFSWFKSMISGLSYAVSTLF